MRISNIIRQIWLGAIILLLLCPPAYGQTAATAPKDTGPSITEMAVALRELGLFQGTVAGLDLDKPCDRLMGAVILVRILGKEQAALSNAYPHPFVDAEGTYASPYIGYLYHNDLAGGLSARVYGLGEMSARQFATMLLRALGYQDKEDFQWYTSLQTLNDWGVLTGAELEQLEENAFSRGLAALLCYRALLTVPKDAQQPLAHRLLWQNAFTTQQLAKCRDSALLLAADMPDTIVSQVNVYTEQQFRDIIWLSLRNRQISLSLRAPGISPERARQIADELTAPYFGRDIKVDIEEGDYSVYRVYSYIAEYMYMQFYYENPQRYTKHYHFYEQQYQQSTGNYISMYVWRETIEKLVNKLITDDMSEYRRLRVLHDYLAANISYDYNVTPQSISHSAQGVLMEGKGVCDGLSSALKMLLNAVGIESIVVYGTSLKELHAWNQVKIDGQWYNVDVTWAGTLIEDDIYYGYFCAPDSIFLRDHFVEKEGIAQPCTATNFYQL